MKQLTLLLILHSTFIFARSEDDVKCAIDNRSNETIWEEKIIHDIENCGYDVFQPPIPNGTETLKISMHFAMKSFKFDSADQEFSASMWTFFIWNDDRLKWDPDKYGNVVKVVGTTGKIWAPGVRLINNVEDDISQRYLWSPCEMSYTGTVECIAWLVFAAKCSIDLRDWPYDAQNCNLEFGLYSEVATKMKLDVARKAVQMIGAEYGTEWDIMDYQQTVNETSEKQLIMKFRLERHAEVLAAIVVYPAIVLSVLTFSSLFIDARFNIRLILICFSLLCHNYIITDLALEIPRNTNNPPRLLLYYRGSFIVTSILVVVSFILNVISRKDITSPNWMMIINDNVLMSFGKYLVWPRWQTVVNEAENENKFAKSWTDFANIVNVLWIFISTMVYISLYCVFMPHPIPYS